MHNHSYENEFNLHVNEISFSYERMSRLALRKRLEVIRKWPIPVLSRSRSLNFFGVLNRKYIRN